MFNNQDELLKALEVIKTGDKNTPEFTAATEKLESYITDSAIIFDVLKRNLTFETITLYDCEDGGDVYYNRAYLNVNEKNFSDFHNLLVFGRRANIVDEKKMWW